MKKLLFISTLLFLIYTPLVAQSNFGGHPLGQDWHVVKSPAARIIYPTGMEASAQRVARIVNYINQNNRRSVGNKKRSIDIMLQTQTVSSNGYVALAPFRSEFYSTPPQSNLTLGAINWLDGLAVHEYRHVLQNLNARNGIVNVAYWLQGEGLWALLNHWVLPNWYYEGDAVINETALTNSGRGRLPYFTILQRSLAQDNINYSYTKNRNGSFRDQVPNQYPLGYMLLTYIRNNYGNDVTKTILKEASSFNGVFYSFSKAVKKHTGYTTTDLYKKVWEDFKNENKKRVANTNLIPSKIITPKNKIVTSYNFPVLLDDGSIITRKKSYNTTDKIVKITNNKETLITSIGYNQDTYLSYNHNMLAWAELRKNGRRNHQTFSDIVIYNLKSKQKKRITSHTRFFSPSISPDGKQIAAIQIDIFEKSHLVILDTRTGIVIKTILNPSNFFLSRTNWTPDGKNIVSIAKKNGKLCVVKINLKQSLYTPLTPWSKHSLESPIVKNNKVYFNASYSGIDNIYTANLTGDKIIHQITSVPVGAFEPTINNNQIVFTQYTEKGTLLSKQSLKNNTTPFIFIEPNKMEQYKTVANVAEGGNILNKIDTTTTYKTEKYKGLLNGLKLHSWNLSPSISTPAININMINILNDVSLNLGAGIHRNENNNLFYTANAKVSRYFPELTLGVTQTNRSTSYFDRNIGIITPLNYKETQVQFMVDLPFSWLKGNYNSWFVPFANINNSSLYNIKSPYALFKNVNNQYYSAGISVGSLKRTAPQNVGPRLGFQLQANISKGIDKTNANKTFINGAIFLPGISKNHNIKLKASYQKELLQNTYQFTDTFEYTRGYTTPIQDVFTNFSFNYQLPLFYPELGFKGI